MFLCLRNTYIHKKDELGYYWKGDCFKVFSLFLSFIILLNSSQPFHFSPIGLNPNLPRSSHMTQLPSHNAVQPPLPHHQQQVNPNPAWQQQMHPHPHHSSNTTTVVGVPVMSHEEQSHNARFSHDPSPHQPTRSSGMPPWSLHCFQKFGLIEPFCFK